MLGVSTEKWEQKINKMVTYRNKCCKIRCQQSNHRVEKIYFDHKTASTPLLNKRLMKKTVSKLFELSLLQEYNCSIQLKKIELSSSKLKVVSYAIRIINKNYVRPLKVKNSSNYNILEKNIRTYNNNNNNNKYGQ